MKQTERDNASYMYVIDIEEIDCNTELTNLRYMFPVVPRTLNDSTVKGKMMKSIVEMQSRALETFIVLCTREETVVITTSRFP